jgi:histone acetyltransferase 1
MEPQLQPHPAESKVIDFSDWACNTTECTEISLGKLLIGASWIHYQLFSLLLIVEYDSNSVEHIKSTTFNPEFTYPFFGDHELAFGYKDLDIQVQHLCNEQLEKFD